MPSVNRRKFLALGGAAGAALGSGLTRQDAIAHAAVNGPAWIDRRNYGPFQCAATFSLAEFDHTFRNLGRLEYELQRTLAIPPGDRPTDVLIFGNQREHREFLARAFPRTPYRRALFVQTSGRGAVYAYRHRELAVDLRHECTHALLHANLPMVPLWLDEGLAEYFEMPDDQRAFGHPHMASLRWNLRLGLIQTIDSLEKAQSLADMGASEYRFAWAWTHFMLHGPKVAHRTLVHFFSDIHLRNPPGLLSTRLQEAVPDLSRRMVQHFKHWRR